MNRPNPDGRALGASPRDRLLAAGAREWQRVIGSASAPAASHIYPVFERGGTLSLFDQVAGFAAHAVTVGAYAGQEHLALIRARQVQDLWRVPTDAELVAGLMLNEARRAAQATVTPWVEIAGWLRVLAGDCDLERAEAMRECLTRWAEPMGQYPIAAMDGLGPYCYAAGMSVTDAWNAWRSGSLSTEALSTLAALRGYRLPPALPSDLPGPGVRA